MPKSYLKLLGEEPAFEKCAIKGDDLCVTGPTKNLYILNAEVALIPVWGGSISRSVGNLWAAIDIQCYFGTKQEISIFLKIIWHVHGSS